MKGSDNMKFVRDVPADRINLRAHRPFKVSRENSRRFVRLEISSPMSMKKIKDDSGNYWPEGDWHVINGSILNISAGGILVDLDQQVSAGEVVTMHFTLQEVENLHNVLGLVKRADIEPDCCIAGIEFITRDYLVDHFSQAELELLSENYMNFDESVRHLINRYIYREKVAESEG